MKPCANALFPAAMPGDLPMRGAIVRDLNPAPGERVRVISDLHLGHERSKIADLEALRPLMRDCRYLVVAGDLAETRPCEFQRDGLGLKARFAALCREEGTELVTVAGNHDPFEEVQLLRLWGGKAVIFHGHALFKVGAPWGWEFLNHKEECRRLIASHPRCDTDLTDRLLLAREMALLAPPVLRREKLSRFAAVRFLQHCAWPPSRPLTILGAWATMGWRIRRFARQFFPEARVVCFGHFHRRVVWKDRKRVYINTGAFFRHARPSAVDLADGRMEAVRPLDWK